MIKGFFFDLDGTLVNTYKADYLAYRDAIKEVMDVVIDEVSFAKTHGQEMRDKLRILIPGINQEAMNRIGNAKKRHYSKYLHLTEANERLILVLAMFAEHYHMVLVTTAKKDNAVSVLKAHGLSEYFSDMVFGDEVAKSKPDPEPYLLALKKTGLRPHEVIAFEDSRSGVVSAERAGIAVVQVRDFAE